MAKNAFQRSRRFVWADGRFNSALERRALWIS